MSDGLLLILARFIAVMAFLQLMLDGGLHG